MTKRIVHAGVSMGAVMFATIQTWAQEQAGPSAVSGGGNEVFGLTPAQWLVFLSNVGFGGVFLYYLLQTLKRQASLEDITKRYDDTQQAHLQAFKDISAAYRELLSETTKSILLSVNVQAKLSEKVERMERDLGGAK